MKSALIVLFCVLAISGGFAHTSVPVQGLTFSGRDFLDVVEGLFEGIGSAQNWTDIQPCIDSSEDAVQNVIEAIHDFEAEDPISVANGLAALGKALQDIPTMASSCAASEQDISLLINSIEAISSPTSFAFRVAKNLFVNGVDIYDEIYTAVEDFNEGKWKDFGFNTGEALAKLFFNAQLEPAAKFHKIVVQRDLQFDMTDFYLVAKGVLEGIGAVKGWDQLSPCINSTEDATRSIIEAISLLRKGGAMNTARGLAALGRALSDLPTCIQSCGETVNNVEALIHSLQAIISPTSYIYTIAKNIIVNGADIYGEIKTAIEEYKVGNWERFGYNVGEALAQIFLVAMNQELRVKHGLAALRDSGDVLMFVKGVVDGLSTDPLYDEIAPCLNNATGATILIREGIEELGEDTLYKKIDGLYKLAAALRIIPVAMQDCKSSYAQLQKLVEVLKELEDPRTITYKLYKSLVINGEETMDKVNEATTNYNAGKYDVAGKAVGTLVANFIRPDDAVAGLGFVRHLQKTASFKVDPNHQFVNWTKAELKSLFGTKLENPLNTSLPLVFSSPLADSLPQNFSSWTKWPSCEHPILNQAHCGSCWAFGAAETLSDRFCIASQGKVNVQLSPQYLVSCSSLNMGCNGGMLTTAWGSMEWSGLPTLDCTPYTAQNGTVDSCSTLSDTCHDGTPIKKYYAKSLSTRWYMSADSIKAEIFENGPVESAFTVYEDFMAYKGGVYKHNSGSALGGHAIKIVGWGNEHGQDYWLVANSWGTTWGENGYFKMAIGDSGMDGNGVAGAADISNLPSSHIEAFLSI